MFLNNQPSVNEKLDLIVRVIQNTVEGVDFSCAAACSCFKLAVWSDKKIMISHGVACNITTSPFPFSALLCVHGADVNKVVVFQYLTSAAEQEQAQMEKHFREVDHFKCNYSYMQFASLCVFLPNVQLLYFPGRDEHREFKM